MDVFVTNENVLLIDLSWFSIQLYFYLKKRSDVDDDLFLLIYKDLFVAQILKVKSKLNIRSNVFLLDDCPIENIWRTKTLYPEYKINRKEKWEKYPIVPNIFPVITDEIIPLLQRTHSIQHIQRDDMEADDLCYLIVKHLREIKFTKKIKIITEDGDYLQLYNSKTDILDMSLKSIVQKRLRFNSVEKTLWFNILLGKRNDNIPPVLNKRIAQKIVERANSFDDIVQEVTNRSGNIDQLYMNQRLMDMSFVPIEQVNTV